MSYDPVNPLDDDIPDYTDWTCTALRTEATLLYGHVTELRLNERTLERKIEELEQQIEQLKADNSNLADELDRLTPETRADIESAYQRGYQAARRQLRTWMLHMFSEMDAHLERPAVTPVPVRMIEEGE